MVEITVTAIKELDLVKLSKFMYDERKNTVIDSESRTFEHILEHRKKVTSDNNIILTAYENDEIIGILRIFTGFPEMTFTSLWDPIITQGESRQRREDIALDLIDCCKKYVKERGFSRLEALFSPFTEKHSEMYKENRSWYEKAGFYKAGHSYESIKEKGDAAIYMSYNDDGLNDDLKRYLQERFPEPSKYEASEEKDKSTK